MNKKILIIDDEIDLLKTFKTVLEKNNYDVITAEDGREGLEKAKRENPDLVITDIIMPEKDGAQVIFELNKELPNIKVIVMTAGEYGDAQNYLKSIIAHSHVKYGFEKPFDMDEMLQKIKEVLCSE